MLSPLALTLAPMALALHRARHLGAEPFVFESSALTVDERLLVLLARAPRYTTLLELALGLGWRPTRANEMRLGRMLRALGWQKVRPQRAGRRPRYWRAA